MLQQNKSVHPYFDRNTTSVIKGIALIMMFIHHFFTFPSWWNEGIQYPVLEKIAPYFCEPLKLCVPIFCFITGYFYYFNNSKSLMYSLKKITDILLYYWSVFVIFAMVNVAVVHYSYKVSDIILELFALRSPTMIFCWYVIFYCISMVILPFLAKLMERNSVHRNLFICLLVVPIVIYGMLFFIKVSIGKGIIYKLVNDFVYFPSILIGYIFAKFDLFQKIDMIGKKWYSIKSLRIFLLSIVAICAAMGRYIMPSILFEIGELPGLSGINGLSISLDFIYAPLFIYCIVNISRCIKIGFIDKILAGIGKQSLLMWFLHCIFFNQAKTVIQPVLYYPHNPVLVLFWGLILCYCAAIILDIGLSRLIAIKNKALLKSYIGKTSEQL